MRVTEKLINDIRSALPGLEMHENEPMSAHCSFRIGGPARLFVQPTDRAQLCRAVALCKAQGVRYYLLGNGSNILFADEGYDGAVLDVSSMQDAVEVHGTQLTAGAGVRLSALCKTALEHGLTGLEFAAGIPGTVGGAAYMNAGAYGGELKDVVTLVTAMEQSGKTVAYTPAELQMSYRHSRFSDEAVPSAILSVTVALHPGDLETIRATIREFAARRREKQPLSVPGCGSTFKRPEGQFAGTLIDNAGLKGLRIGGASVSTLHAGFLVNDENGTAADYLALVAAVQKAVQEDSGVWLEPEVRILGEDAPVSLL